MSRENCRNREDALLLLTHGELPLWQRVGVLTHLLLCPACRHRYRAFSGVSTLLLAATRAHAAERSLPTLASAAQPVAFALAFLTAVVALTIHFVSLAIERNRPPGLQPMPKRMNGCAPYLPNDHCR
ncbi:MAG: hypothetical protein OHK0029_31600 [Armatimonadaceae bacterium]